MAAFIIRTITGRDIVAEADSCDGALGVAYGWNLVNHANPVEVLNDTLLRIEAFEVEDAPHPVVESTTEGR